MPGEPGYETAKDIIRTYGNGAEQAPSIAVVTVPQGHTVAGDAEKVAAAFAQVRRELPRVRVVDLASAHDGRFVTDDGRTTFALLFGPRAEGFGDAASGEQATAVLERALPAGTRCPRPACRSSRPAASTDGPGVLAETLFGALGALAVLAFVFASLLAFLPLLMAAFAILTTLLIVLGLTYVGDISAIVQFLVALVGLGVAIDYALLVVTRWREERHHGRETRTRSWPRWRLPAARSCSRA